MILTNKLAFSTLNPLLWENIIPSSHARYMMRWHQPFGVGDPLRVQAKIQPDNTDTYTLHIRKAGIGHFEHTLDGETVITVPFTRNVLSVGNVFIDAYYEINLDYGCYYAEVRDSQDRPMAYSHFFQVIEDLSNTFEWRIRQDRSLNLFSFKTIYNFVDSVWLDWGYNQTIKDSAYNFDIPFTYKGSNLESELNSISIWIGDPSPGVGNPWDVAISFIQSFDNPSARLEILDTDGNVLKLFEYENYAGGCNTYLTNFFDNCLPQYIKFRVIENEEDYPDSNGVYSDAWESDVIWVAQPINGNTLWENSLFSTIEIKDFFMRLYGGFREDEVDINIKGGVFEQQDLIPYEMHAKAYEKLKLTIDSIPNWKATKVALWTTIREKTIDDAEMAWNGDDIEVVDRDKLDRGFQILKISFSDKFGIDEQKSSYGAYICDETYTPIETTQGTLIL